MSWSTWDRQVKLREARCERRSQQKQKIALHRALAPSKHNTEDRSRLMITCNVSMYISNMHERSDTWQEPKKRGVRIPIHCPPEQTVRSRVPQKANDFLLSSHLTRMPKDMPKTLSAKHGKSEGYCLTYTQRKRALNSSNIISEQVGKDRRDWKSRFQ